MKIVVLNGSPKGDMSITLRYVRYMAMKHPEQEFDVINVAADINRIEKNEDYFSSVIRRIEASDAVLWSFPLYYMLVPGQYKRFIELVFERDAKYAFENKYAASISTSIHFMDQIAHDYIHAVSEDLGMKFHDFHSPHMRDLLNVSERKNLVQFISLFLDTIDKKIPIQPVFEGQVSAPASYAPVKPVKTVDAGDLSVHILTDANENGSNIAMMTERLIAAFGGKAKVTHIRDIGMKGGCLGCCRCAFENKCVYDDGFCEWYRNEFLSSDIIIFAGSVRDRFISSAFKQVIDRSFFMGHTPTMNGKTIGYMVSGHLQGNQILREFFSAFTDCGKIGYGRGISDECSNQEILDDRIDGFAESIVGYAKSDYIRPPTFYAIGGGKVIRDMIWSYMRAFFKADHRYFKKHKLYDFPQYDYGTRIKTSMLGFLLSIPQVKKASLPRMKEHMIEPFDKVLGEIEK